MEKNISFFLNWSGSLLLFNTRLSNFRESNWKIDTAISFQFLPRMPIRLKELYVTSFSNYLKSLKHTLEDIPEIDDSLLLTLNHKCMPALAFDSQEDVKKISTWKISLTFSS